MKYIKLILLLFSLQTINAQQIDTLNYIKQFETNKVNYIGKPLSVLLNDMSKTPPKTVWFNINVDDKYNVIESHFKFSTKEKSFKNAITLSITWKEKIPFKSVEYLYKKNKFYFTDEEKNFYGNKIIQDITVYR
jgi:hypothetical protein